MPARLVIGYCTVILAAVGRTGPWRAAELGHSNQAEWTTPSVTPIGDAATFKAAWVQLYSVQAFRPAVPAVDFHSWRVILVALGSRPSGGYSARLDSARVVNDTAVIVVGVVTPPKGCAVSMELTTPAVAIATPAVPLPYRIVFHERADSARCN